MGFSGGGDAEKFCSIGESVFLWRKFSLVQPTVYKIQLKIHICPIALYHLRSGSSIKSAILPTREFCSVYWDFLLNKHTDRAVKEHQPFCEEEDENC